MLATAILDVLAVFLIASMAKWFTFLIYGHARPQILPRRSRIWLQFASRLRRIGFCLHATHSGYAHTDHTAQQYTHQSNRRSCNLVLLQCDGTARFVHFCDSEEGAPAQVSNDGAVTYTIMLYAAHPTMGSGACVRRTFPNSSVMLRDCGVKMTKAIASRQPMPWLPLRLKQLYTCALAEGITCQTCMLCDADDTEFGPAKQCQFCLIVLRNSCCQKLLD